MNVLTAKVIQSGQEALFPVASVKRVGAIIHLEIIQPEGTRQLAIEDGTVYVMNAAAATVAKYQVGTASAPRTPRAA
jgi:hypothetical protein